jgi:hypothetical protein
MTTKLKVLGQSNPTSNTFTPIYTVPASNSAIISTITVCNTGTANALFSLAVQPANAAISTKHYIAFNTTVPAYDTIHLTFGIAMATTDTFSANVNTPNIAIGLYGTEVY